MFGVAILSRFAKIYAKNTTPDKIKLKYYQGGISYFLSRTLRVHLGLAQDNTGLWETSSFHLIPAFHSYSTD